MKKYLVPLSFAAALTLCVPAMILAQPSPLPPRTHSRPTMMSAKAQGLQTQVAQDIAKAKAAGSDVTAAQHHKDEGDAALNAGHYRIAVDHYKAAQKALSAK